MLSNIFGSHCGPLCRVALRAEEAATTFAEWFSGSRSQVQWTTVEVTVPDPRALVSSAVRAAGDAVRSADRAADRVVPLAGRAAEAARAGFGAAWSRLETLSRPQPRRTPGWVYLALFVLIPLFVWLMIKLVKWWQELRVDPVAEMLAGARPAVITPAASSSFVLVDAPGPSIQTPVRAFDSGSDGLNAPLSFQPAAASAPDQGTARSQLGSISADPYEAERRIRRALEIATAMSDVEVDSVLNARDAEVIALLARFQATHARARSSSD